MGHWQDFDEFRAQVVVTRPAPCSRLTATPCQVRSATQRTCLNAAHAPIAADPESLASFLAITGSTPEQATFYLDSASNNLELAVSAFFDAAGGAGTGAGDEDDLMGENDEDDDDEQASAPVPAAAAASSGGGRTLGGGPAPSAARAPAATYTSGGGTLGGGAASPMPAGWGTGSGASSSCVPFIVDTSPS